MCLSLPQKARPRSQKNLMTQIGRFSSSRSLLLHHCGVNGAPSQLSCVQEIVASRCPVQFSCLEIYCQYVHSYRLRVQSKYQARLFGNLCESDANSGLSNMSRHVAFGNGILVLSTLGTLFTYIWFAGIGGHGGLYVYLIYFESVFFDVPRVIPRLFTLNKYLDETCRKISKNLDLNCLKSKFY